MLAVAKFRWPQPHKAIRLVLTAAGIMGALLVSSDALNRYSSVALLWVMASIKPMEANSLRDEFVTLFMAYFLAVSCLFFSSSLAVGIYIIISIGVTTAALIYVNHPVGELRSNLGLSAKLILMALPLALILFIVFPRIQGGAWGIRSDATAVSGFTDILAPGNVTRLVRNTAIAFRVKFNSSIPSPERLYWRGAVFWRFDGRAWHLSDSTLNTTLPIDGHNISEYTVALEPPQPSLAVRAGPTL